MIQTHDEMVAVIRAHEEGKDIEYKYVDGPWASMDLTSQFFNFSECCYRVKPEAREWWITCDQIDADGRVVNPVFYDHLPAWNNRKTIHVREVLP